MKSNATANNLEEEKSEVQLKIKQKHLKLIEEKKNKPSDYFYKVSNPGELTKIGMSYLDDFKNGIKNFAISSTNYKAAQQRTVLALASYFDHLFDMKILIVSDSLGRGVFEEVMGATTRENMNISSTDKKIEVNHFFHHFDFIDLNKIIALSVTEKPTYDFEVAMNNILKNYDIVFWDTPIMNTQKNNSNIYLHTMMYYESLTIVVSPAVSKASNVNEIRDHFHSFGVNVKGVLFDNVDTYSNDNRMRYQQE